MQQHLTVAEGDTENTEPGSSEGFCIAKDERKGLQDGITVQQKGGKITMRVDKHCYISPESWWNIHP